MTKHNLTASSVPLKGRYAVIAVPAARFGDLEPDMEILFRGLQTECLRYIERNESEYGLCEVLTIVRLSGKAPHPDLEEIAV